MTCWPFCRRYSDDATRTDVQTGAAVLSPRTRTANVYFFNPPINDHYCTGLYLIIVSDASGQVAVGRITLS